jgi:DNA-binding NarL/FixJ family response regulator
MNAIEHTVEVSSPRPGTRIPVWLIDDSRHFSHTASSILNESAEVECTRVFSRCEQAIEALRAEDNLPSVILLDIEMPGMGGIDAIKPIKKIAPSTRILMITAYSYDDYIRKSIAAGASGYLLKNSSGREYVEAIQTAVSGGTPIAPSVMTKMVKMIAQEASPVTTPKLTTRELDILRLIKDGLDDRQIAEKLGMRYNTILWHTKNLHDKFGVHSRRELIVKALKARVL